MRWYRALFRLCPFQRPSDSQKPPNPSKITKRMSSASGMAAAGLYSLTMSSPAALGAVPEDSAEKKHHLKNGKGFTNPWESWRDFNPLTFMGTMVG
jgi:N-acyl-phosphatidylethanolamine-hydrolysing phospholipase D